MSSGRRSGPLKKVVSGIQTPSVPHCWRAAMAAASSMPEYIVNIGSMSAMRLAGIRLLWYALVFAHQVLGTPPAHVAVGRPEHAAKPRRKLPRELEPIRYRK